MRNGCGFIMTYSLGNHWQEARLKILEKTKSVRQLKTLTIKKNGYHRNNKGLSYKVSCGYLAFRKYT